LKHVREIRRPSGPPPGPAAEIDRLVMKLMAGPADRLIGGLMLTDLAKIRDSMPVGSMPGYRGH
jgi:hypothetical protein